MEGLFQMYRSYSVWQNDEYKSRVACMTESLFGIGFYFIFAGRCRIRQLAAQQSVVQGGELAPDSWFSVYFRHNKAVVFDRSPSQLSVEL